MISMSLFEGKSRIRFSYYSSVIAAFIFPLMINLGSGAGTIAPNKLPSINMSRIQNGKNRNPEKPIPGCLGRMVNLFDLNTVVGGNRLLTDKPHHDGSSFSRRQSDVSTTSLVDDQMDDKAMVSELRKSPSNGTPIKMLIAHEMSKEEECKQSPSNLVAKLMGLDVLPQQQHQTGSASCRNHHMRETRSKSGSLEFLKQEHGLMDNQSKHVISQYPPEQGEYKDVYEIWEQHREPEFMRDDSSRKGRCNDSKMALVREKFMEAKRLSTDEKLRQSKQFQDALEVLSSNKDLFLKFLQEPNSLFSHHLYSLQSAPPPPPPDSRRITVLKPSKLVDSHKIIGSGKKNEKQVKEPAQMGCPKPWDKSSSDFLFSPECCKTDDNPTPPTRIVVLKPSSGKPHNVKVVFDGDREDSEALESRQVAEESGLRRDETLLSSGFSNGYIGDDSSFGKSEIEYPAAGNLSDSEAVSPTSRHSWDYINRFNSPYSTSSSRASYSPESSVCREAKKRLSERWAMMVSNKSLQEQRQIQRSSSTLGDMLALSDFKKPVNSEEICKSKEEESRGSLSFLSIDLNKKDDADNGPRNLPRSKSVPASSSGLGEGSGFLKGKTDDTKDLITEKLVKSSSFKGRVSSLFFSKSKKSSKEKFHEPKDVPQSARFPLHSPRNVGNEGSECVNGMIVEEESCTQLHRSSRKASGRGSSDAGVKQGIILPEAGFSFTKTEIPGNHSENQDQPSPISVLEPQFEEHDRSTDSHRNPKLNAHGIEPMRYNLIDKSPPIGSIARTLSWDDSTLGSSTPYAGRPSSAPLGPEEEEQECLFYVQSLLSVAGLNGNVRSNSFLSKWHSPESPLDPSLRDKYMNLASEKDPILIQTKRRHHTAISKLVFDSVNEALTDIAGRGPCTGAHNSLEDMALVKDRVWARIKEWISVEERWDWEEEEGGGVAVEGVVRKEVVGRGWVGGLRLEVDDTRKEIEGKLLEELVEECVLELTGRA
ncbi:hypothetical protein L6452_38050 [Arctium lappa]|uniref:Uncharacterized protein n=1 Tax=Arctium lappa TaxID=4217 RepID=A0ACB8Y5D3_ARCLA|nr:hypothetical protein L6452_38050 [Arctium lappa]